MDEIKHVLEIKPKPVRQKTWIDNSINLGAKFYQRYMQQIQMRKDTIELGVCNGRVLKKGEIFIKSFSFGGKAYYENILRYYQKFRRQTKTTTSYCNAGKDLNFQRIFYHHWKGCEQL